MADKEKKVKFFKVLETADGQAISAEAETYEEAKTKVLQSLLQTGAIGEKSLDQGRVDQRYPWLPQGFPPADVGAPGAGSIYDPSMREDYNIEPINPAANFFDLTQPHSTDPLKAPGGNVLPPSAEMGWQDVVNILGQPAAIAGDPAVVPPEAPGILSGYGGDGLSPEQLRGLAGVQELTGASPMTAPGMYIQGPFGSEEELVQLGDSAYRSEIEDSVGAAVDFNNPFDVNLLERARLNMSIGLTPPSRAQLAELVEMVVSPEYPNMETFISPDPGHPGNTFLWARRSPEDAFQVVDLGLGQEMVAEIPGIAAAVGASVAGVMGYGKMMNRVFPFIARGKGTVSQFLYKHLKDPSGAANRIGKIATSVISGTGGELIENELEALALTAWADQPPLSYEDRVTEATQLLVSNGVGEVGGAAVLAPLGKAYTLAKDAWGVSPNSFRAAERALNRYAPDGDMSMRPYMISQLGRSRGWRLMNLTSYGQKVAVRRAAAALEVFQKYNDDVGGMLHILRRYSDLPADVRGEVAEAFGPTWKGAQRLPAGTEGFGEALTNLNAVLRDMDEALWGRAALKEYSPASRRSWDQTKDAQGNIKDKGRLQDAQDNMDTWVGTMGNSYELMYNKVGANLDSIGAVFDLTGPKQNVTGLIRNRKKNVAVVPGPGGEPVPKITYFGSEIDPKGDLALFLREFGINPATGAPIPGGLPDIKTGPGSFSAIMQLKTKVDGMEFTGNDFENQILHSLKTGLYETMHNPTATNAAPGVLEDLLRSPLGSKKGPGLDAISESYKRYMGIQTKLTATLAATNQTPTQIGRNIIDPINNPDLAKWIAKVYTDNGNMTGLKELQSAYIEKIMAMDAEAAIGILKMPGRDVDTKKALDAILPRPVRTQLGDYLQAKQFLEGSPEAISVVADVTASGKALIQAMNNGDKAARNGVFELLKKGYSKDGVPIYSQGQEVWKRIAKWSIINEALQNSQSFSNNMLILDKNVLRKTLLTFKTQGIFDDLMTPAERNSFDDMLSLIEFIPQVSTMDTAIGMAAQQQAGRTMPIPNPTQPIGWIQGKAGVMTNAMNARFMLDGWLAGPVGYGKGTFTMPTLKFTLGRLITSADRIKAMGKRFRPGVYAEGSAQSRLNDIANGNLKLVPLVGEPDTHFNDGYQELLRQAEMQNVEEIEAASRTDLTNSALGIGAQTLEAFGTPRHLGPSDMPPAPPEFLR